MILIRLALMLCNSAEVTHATESPPLNIQHVITMQDALYAIPSKHGWIKGKGKSHRFKAHTGEIHGKLKIENLLFMHPKKGGVWLGKCECGNFRQISAGNLKTVKSCLDCVVWKEPTHGETVRGPTVEYRTLMAMINRCHNPKASNYQYYGGKGIQVAEEWRGGGTKFEAFLAHVGRRPSDKAAIDRIDNEKNYEPGNVRWATAKEEARNRSVNILVTFRGHTCCLSEMAERYGLTAASVRARMKKYKTLEEVFLKPLQKRAQRI